MTPGTGGRGRPAELQDELRYLLIRWDPIGIYDEHLDFPPDEYDCLIGPLLTRLAHHDSPASLSEYLRHEIEDHFTLDPVLCETDRFADRLLAATYAAIARRRGTKIAIIVISRKLLTRAWHLLAAQASTPAVSAVPAAATAPQTGRVTKPRARSLMRHEPTSTWR